MAITDPLVCDSRFAHQFSKISQYLFNCSEWTRGIATVVDVNGGLKYTHYTSNVPDVREYHFECEAMVYSPSNGSSVDITGRHFGIRQCLSKAASTLYSFDKIRELSEGQGIALAQVQDAIRINGILSSPKFSDFQIVKKDYGPSTGLTPEKIIKASSLLGGNCVNTIDGMVTILAGSGAKPALFDPSRNATVFFPGNPLYSGKVMQFLGMEIRFGPNEGINAIPSKDGNYAAILVHKKALIQTENMPLTQQVRPSLTGRLGWEFLSEIVSGAGVVDSDGVVLIEYDLANTPNTKF